MPDESARLAQVSGRIVDSRSGKPLAQVYVGAADTEYQTASDAQGAFSLKLPPGRYTLQIAFDLYELQAIEVELAPRQELRLERPIKLVLEAKSRVERTVIREPDRNSTEATNLQRKNAAAVTDRMSAEEIKKSADSSASQAAARLVGATVVGDRFVYVRGLGERYSNALFNGAPLPSPEPDQQAVPFDIFPSSLLANLTLAKSATPDIPGDFAGGSVQINTRDFPGKLTLNLAGTFGANTQTAFQPMLSYRGGGLDWLGLDDGTRARPLQLPGQSRAEYGRSFPNIWSPQRVALGSPNYSLSASLGNNATVAGKKLGYLVSLSYSAQAQTREEEIRVLNLIDTGTGKELRPLVSYGGEPGAFGRGDGPYSVRSTYSVQWGTLATVSLSPAAGHRITLSGVFTQNGDRESRIYQGFSQDQFADLWTSRLRFISRSFGFVQLGGTDHLERSRMGGSDIDWSVTYAAAARSEPDNREVTYLRKDDGKYHYSPQSPSGQRFFSDNVEHQINANLDFTQAFKQWRDLASRIKLGAAARYRMRSFEAHRYKFGFGGLRDLDDTLPPEQIFAAENIGTKLDFRENTNTADTYSGRMAILAAYALVDLPLASRLRLTTGLRFEAALQRLSSRDPRNADMPLEVALDTYDPLPSANLVYQINSDMNLRAGASMTVARPEFRELAPFQFADFFGGELVQGNPALSRTRIANTDLRWEWFLGPVDLVAVSAFYKYFDRPIETTINAGGDLIRSFANARSATNFGAELEARKELAYRGRGLRGVSVGGNLTLIYSRVDLTDVEGQQTSRQRALQGQSPFVLNAFIELDRADWGTQARVLYNVFGERIDQVGAFGLPDKYEQPRHQLDVTVSQRLAQGLMLRLSARNLINSPVHVIQRGTVLHNGQEQPVAETTLRYQTGAVVSATLSYNR
ncbi:MAG: TonB-dependent receptor [Polyangia bacterium]